MARVQERVLAALERKHGKERTILMELVLESDDDPQDWLEQVQHISNVVSKQLTTVITV